MNKDQKEISYKSMLAEQMKAIKDAWKDYSEDDIEYVYHALVLNLVNVTNDLGMLIRTVITMFHSGKSRIFKP
jgi:hypothetical protein